jgi:hypothetical protein
VSVASALDPCRHAPCSHTFVHQTNRRKSSTVILMDRRKSYLDVIERVLGAGYLPESPPAAVHVDDVVNARRASFKTTKPKVIVLRGPRLA